MAAMPTPQAKFDENVLNQLACPACRGELRQENARLVCIVCRRAYPIVDGIPVLIIDRAETIADPRDEEPSL
jgi:uncharacterized protein YbaR (Trm112 family)